MVPSCMEHTVWAAAAGFILGITLSHFGTLSAPVVLFILILACAVWFSTERDIAIIFVIGASCVIAGMWRADVAVPHDATLEASIGEEAVIEGIIVTEPDARERSTRLIVELQSGARVLVVRCALW
jgi:uncharacterized membrane protein YhhN